MSSAAKPIPITAAALHRARDLRLEERLIWHPSPGHVQVKVVATGLCGSDVHYFSEGRNGEFAVIRPLVLGHEASGIVTDVGPEVRGFTIGQRVAIEAGINCLNCSFCTKGRYNLCSQMRFCSSAARYPHEDGTLQTMINHPVHALHPIPDNCSFELAALAEPLSVVLHASRRCQLSPGQSVIVFGVGTIGLLACALAKHIGASRVVALDLKRDRLNFAKENGFADDIYCIPTPTSSSSSSSSSSADPCFSIPSSSSKNPSSQHLLLSDEQLKYAKANATAALSHFSAPQGFDVVFECSGGESAIQTSVFTATTGGKVMLIGMGTRAAYLPISNAALREIDILGSFRYCNTYPQALALLAQGTMPMVSKIVTHRYKLEDVKKAFEILSSGDGEQNGLVLKVMVGTGMAC